MPKFDAFGAFTKLMQDRRSNLPSREAGIRTHVIYSAITVMHGLSLLSVGIAFMLYDILAPLLRLAIFLILFSIVLSWFGIHIKSFIPGLPVPEWRQERPVKRPNIKPDDHYSMVEPPSGQEPSKQQMETWPLVLAALGGAGVALVAMLTWKVAAGRKLRKQKTIISLKTGGNR